MLNESEKTMFFFRDIFIIGSISIGRRGAPRALPGYAYVQGGYTQTMSKYLSLKISNDIKQYTTLAYGVQKLIFWFPILMKFPGEWSQEISVDQTMFVSQ